MAGPAILVGLKHRRVLAQTLAPRTAFVLLFRRTIVSISIALINLALPCTNHERLTRMRCFWQLAAAITFCVSLVGGHAFANVCRTNTLMCATTMPVDGYCECTSHGTTEDGTVVVSPPARQHLNATAGGCGLHPNDPGCRGGAGSGPPRQ